LAATPTVPYSKTLIDDKQIEPPVIRPVAAAREESTKTTRDGRNDAPRWSTTTPPRREVS